MKKLNVLHVFNCCLFKMLKHHKKSDVCETVSSLEAVADSHAVPGAEVADDWAVNTFICVYIALFSKYNLWTLFLLLLNGNHGTYF